MIQQPSLSDQLADRVRESQAQTAGLLDIGRGLFGATWMDGAGGAIERTAQTVAEAPAPRAARARRSKASEALSGAAAEMSSANAGEKRGRGRRRAEARQEAQTPAQEPVTTG